MPDAEEAIAQMNGVLLVILIGTHGSRHCYMIAMHLLPACFGVARQLHNT